MPTWNNKQYADWLSENSVLSATMCLAEVEWSEDGGWIPVRVQQVSVRADGNDLIVPPDSKVYRAMYFLKVKNEYIIGLGEPKRIKKKKKE